MNEGKTMSEERTETEVTEQAPAEEVNADTQEPIAPAETTDTDKTEESENPLKDLGNQEGEEAEDGAPETPTEYQAFSLPEGQELDDELLSEFTGLARDFNLSQEQAQALVDFQGKIYGKFQSSLEDKHNEMVSKWETEIKGDKEYGGAKIKETVSAVNRTLGRFGSEELRSLLVDSELIKNPNMIRFLAKIDATTRPDKLVQGTPPTRMKPKTLAEALYGRSH